MGEKFDVIQRGCKFDIKCEHSPYILTVDVSSQSSILAPHDKIVFKVPSKFEEHSLITGRDIADYKRDFPDMRFDASLKYVEVGAGLGEFIPYIIQMFDGKLKNKPIVIDPADYALMKEMLTYAKKLEFEDAYKRRFELFIERCTLISDQERVTLLNTTLDAVLRDHMELLGHADVVVDSYGASYYGNLACAGGLTAEDPTRTIPELETLLIREGMDSGLFITY